MAEYKFILKSPKDINRFYDKKANVSITFAKWFWPEWEWEAFWITIDDDFTNKLCKKG